MACWNIVLLVAGLGIVGGVGEVALRLSRPFGTPHRPLRLVPGIGVHYKPHAEFRRTDHSNFWVSARTNSYGFVDREPPASELAAAGCHVAVVGDSFVEGGEVPMADKLHIRLEQMAADRLPGWDVTTSAYGFFGTGQVHQLGYWDKWIRRLRPDLVVLVVVANDFHDNRHRASPYHPFLTANRLGDGRFVLVSPDSIHQPRPVAAAVRAWRRIPARLQPYVVPWLRNRLRQLSRHPPRNLLSEDQVDHTAFALDQWTERTRRGGARLVVLATHTLKTWPVATSNNLFEHVTRMANARGLSVVDQYDYIARRGADLANAAWNPGGHWTPFGHQLAADALIEYLKASPGACGDRAVRAGRRQGARPRPGGTDLRGQLPAPSSSSDDMPPAPGTPTLAVARN